MKRARLLSAVIAGALVLATAAPEAGAFCGFYVSGADAKLFNNATQVVLMREGQRTVLSMQNNYEGPPENFALVIPVPVVLEKENVKTLPREVFARIDQLTAPRLVEYWEQDPCEHHKVQLRRGAPVMDVAKSAVMESASASDLGVTVEAKFSVGEYDVVVLGAKDSGGLDTWLKQEKYKIPDGAEPYLRPYVQSGSKFFVAKVDVKKVKIENGQAMLSPIRFFYDSEKFSLPVRLGLINAKGPQDLIVNVLAKGQRYEVANYPNTTIPTNIDVKENAKATFGSFYTALFDKTLEKYPRAVVTEYAWESASCDPCPVDPLSPAELSTFGADVVPSAGGPESGGVVVRRGPKGPRSSYYPSGYVVTRLHARYTKDSLGEDLVFRAAGALVGGRESWTAKEELERTAMDASSNNFQGRYIIRHPWKGAITCSDPQRGNWGGPPGGREPKAIAAQKLAFAPRDASLDGFLSKPLADKSFFALPGPSPLAATTAVVASAAPAATAAPTAVPTPSASAPAGDGGIAPPQVDRGGCGCDLSSTRAAPAAALGAMGTLAALTFLGRRGGRRRKHGER